MYSYRALKDVSEVEVIRLVNDVFKDYIVPIDWNLKTFEKDVKEYSISLTDSFICYDDGKPIGFSIVSHRGELGRIDSIGVLPNYRGKGIASEIIYRTIENLKWKGIKKIILEVEKNEQRAINFYKKHGFKEKRNLVSMNLKTNSKEKYNYKYVEEDNVWLKENAFKAKTNLGRKPNWQRHPQTLEKSEDRYMIEKVIEWGYTIGYVVWGENVDNVFIVDASPIDDNTPFNDFISDVIKRVTQKHDSVSVVGVPENDLLYSALLDNGFKDFLTQVEMEKKIH
jgi:ribosomal protein S18 acetylase RimI-like enzyme